MNKMELVKFKQTLQHPQGKLNYLDKELSSYIFLQFNLSNVNFTTQLLETIFDKDLLLKLLNIYLNFIDKNESERFLKLKEEGFIYEKLLDLLVCDINENYNTYSTVFYILKSQLEGYLKEKYKNSLIQNPLDEIIQNTFMKNFFEGLNFDTTEKYFFILNLLNSKLSWIFPNNIEDNIKQEIFESIAKTTLPPHYTRLLNEKLINLGLFSNFWEVSDYVNSYFQNNKQTLSIEDFNYDFKMDCIDYADIEKINQKDFNLFSKLINKNSQNNETSYQLVYGTNNYRLNNYISFCCKKNSISLKKINFHNFIENKNELAFYIYALARECHFENSILVVDSKLVNILTKKNENNNVFEQIINKNSKTNFEILSKTKTPVILLSELNDKTNLQAENILEKFEQINIDVFYSWKIELPKETKYKYCAERFFSDNKTVPLSLLGTIVNECENNKISAENWNEVSKLFSHAENFSKTDIKHILCNKFNIQETKIQKKDSHYSFEALNTKPSACELIESLLNAQKWEKHHKEKLGCSIKCFGPSGTGKTEMAKQVAKKLNMPLKIVHASDILSPFSGEAEKNIKTIFEEANKNNSILLFDEADTFLHTRGDNLNRHNDFKVNEFLTQMEDFNGILFCCTNLPENFDKATDRRFNFHVEFKSLTQKGIDILCNSYFKEYNLSSKQKEEIFNTGEITPGDFKKIYKNLRFISKDKINAEFICQELITSAKQKKRSYENTNKIGFSC